MAKKKKHARGAIGKKSNKCFLLSEFDFNAKKTYCTSYRHHATHGKHISCLDSVKGLLPVIHSNHSHKTPSTCTCKVLVKLCSQMLADQIGKARFDALIGWIVCLLQPSVMMSSPNVLTLQYRPVVKSV